MKISLWQPGGMSDGGIRKYDLVFSRKRRQSFHWFRKFELEEGYWHVEGPFIALCLWKSWYGKHFTTRRCFYSYKLSFTKISSATLTSRLHALASKTSQPETMENISGNICGRTLCKWPTLLLYFWGWECCDGRVGKYYPKHCYKKK